MLNHAKYALDIIQGIVLAIKTSVHATDALFFEVKMMSDQVTCEWCGCDDLYPDEMSDKEPGKCLECVQEECSHSNVLREYQGSNDHRVRFLELCCKCKQSREVRLYFHNKYPSRTDWEYTGEY